VHVVVDEPQGFNSSIPSIWEVTTPQLAIARFHGRNRETWEKKDCHLRRSDLTTSIPKPNFASLLPVLENSPKTQKKRTRYSTTVTGITGKEMQRISGAFFNREGADASDCM
jgi:hypothetical protein